MKIDLLMIAASVLVIALIVMFIIISIVIIFDIPAVPLALNNTYIGLQ